jgi:hypothetical protein
MPTNQGFIEMAGRQGVSESGLRLFASCAEFRELLQIVTAIPIRFCELFAHAGRCLRILCEAMSLEMSLVAGAFTKTLRAFAFAGQSKGSADGRLRAGVIGTAKLASADPDSDRAATRVEAGTPSRQGSGTWSSIRWEQEPREN